MRKREREKVEKFFREVMTDYAVCQLFSLRKNIIKFLKEITRDFNILIKNVQQRERQHIPSPNNVRSYFSRRFTLFDNLQNTPQSTNQPNERITMPRVEHQISRSHEYKRVARERKTRKNARLWLGCGQSPAS